MTKNFRLTGDERREAILRAVKEVFAKNGFDGTTTKDLAKAAGVSEALIFQHFPNKESLFEAMVGTCSSNDPHVQEIMSLEPSTSALITLTHFLVSKIVKGTADDEATSRLMAWSLLKDGDFARIKLKGLSEHLIPKLEECLKAAQKMGDLFDIPVRPDLKVWFMHHIAVVVSAHNMPESPALDYKASKSALAEQITWFSLLGMGLKPDVVKRYYNPKALSLLTK